MWQASYRNVLLSCILFCIVFTTVYVRRNLLQGNELNYVKNIKTGDDHQHSTQERHGPDAKSNVKSIAVPEQRENALMKQKHSTATNKAKIYSDRYLFPIRQNSRGGSNSQVWIFKKAVMMSILTNRTLVMTPFFLSGGHAAIPYSTERLRPFNVTFDADMLSQVVPVATIEAFKRVCNQNNIKVILWPMEATKYEIVKKLIYTDIIDVDLPSKDKVTILEHRQIDQMVSITENESCVALSIDGLEQAIKFVDSKQLGQLQHLADKHLTPSPNIVHIANDLTKKICPGRRYLAYHWRNKTAEMACFFGRERQENECASRRKEIRKFAEISAEAVTNLMKSEQIECIYLACPLWALEMVDILSKRIPRASIFTSGDILGSKKYKTLLDDYYKLSLVEQEICLRAAVFVASHDSSWSKFVVANREANGKTNYNIKTLVKLPHDIPPGLIR